MCRRRSWLGTNGRCGVGTVGRELSRATGYDGDHSVSPASAAVAPYVAWMSAAQPSRRPLPGFRAAAL